eukprot:c27203_g1_i1 orf=326-2707(-)
MPSWNVSNAVIKVFQYIRSLWSSPRNSMDPEQTFLRVHARLSGMLARLITPRLRTLLEHLCFLSAIVILGFLAVMHVNFVGQPGCSGELTQKDAAEAQLLQIKIIGYGLWLPQKVDHLPSADRFVTRQSETKEMLQITEVSGDAFNYLLGKSWLSWLGFNARKIKAGKRVFKNEKGREYTDVEARTISETVVHKHLGRQIDTEKNMPEAGRRPLKSLLIKGVIQLWGRWSFYSATHFQRAKGTVVYIWQLVRIAGRELFMERSKDNSDKAIWGRVVTILVDWLEKRSELFEPVYVYGIEKGYLVLPETAKAQHNIRTINISISARNPCFGNRWQQLLINSFVGYDTILMNSLLHARGEGYLFNFQTKELYDLNYLHESSGVPNSFEGYFVSKSGVLIMSLFVFFTTTMSVSFTLRETQARMLRFTVQLQYHARHRLPTYRLIFIHVIESLVFVPIMIGILFFLFEFYDDQMLAFLVLTLVWLCELFTMISVRTPMSMQYFPRFFLLYFIVFHIYFFSYEYGFSFLAFSATAAFMQHLVLYFWNHFEVPALQRFLRTRTVLQPQQQSGLQITSSAVITSTFHVTRLRPGSFAGAESVNQLSGHRTSSSDSLTGVAHSAAMRFMGGAHIGGHQNNVATASDGSRVTGVTAGIGNRPDNEHHSNTGRDYSFSMHSNTRVVDGGQGQDRDEVRSMNASQEPQLGVPLTAANPNSLVQQSPLSSFGSILLWILGGPSETLVSFLPMFRDFRDQGSNEGHSSGQVNQDGDSQRSLHTASASQEGLRHRSTHPSEDSQTI